MQTNRLKQNRDVFATPTKLTVMLGDRPLIDVMRAAAGQDPTERTRAVALLMASGEPNLVRQILMVTEDREHIELFGENSMVNEVLAALTAMDCRQRRDLEDFYVDHPWAGAHPRAFAAASVHEVVSLVRRLLEVEPSRWAYNDRRDREARLRAVDLMETWGLCPEFLNVLREMLDAASRGRDDLRERLASCIARIEAEQRQSALLRAEAAEDADDVDGPEEEQQPDEEAVEA
jgi:hypothetical protein